MNKESMGQRKRRYQAMVEEGAGGDMGSQCSAHEARQSSGHSNRCETKPAVGLLPRLVVARLRLSKIFDSLELVSSRLVSRATSDGDCGVGGTEDSQTVIADIENLLARIEDAADRIGGDLGTL